MNTTCYFQTLNSRRWLRVVEIFYVFGLKSSLLCSVNDTFVFSATRRSDLSDIVTAMIDFLNLFCYALVILAGFFAVYTILICKVLARLFELVKTDDN